jgi:hypothetical protein
MSLLSRFLGRKDPNDAAPRPLVANADSKNPLSLQVLFLDPYRLDAEPLLTALKAFHPSMSDARCEIDADLNQQGTLLGMIGWGRHIVRLVGFNAPMPAAAVEKCVAPSHYSQALKERARSHQAHSILFYAGYETSAFERYLALAAAAAVLADFGAFVVLNESGHTSLPAAALSSSDAQADAMDHLRSLPLLMLYCGFVKLEVEGRQGVWMRTYGAPLMQLPDLAAHAHGHEEGQRYFALFETIFDYLRTSGRRLAQGDTMQSADDEYLRFRTPSADESFLTGTGELLIADSIGAHQITPA